MRKSGKKRLRLRFGPPSPEKDDGGVRNEPFDERGRLVCGQGGWKRCGLPYRLRRRLCGSLPLFFASVLVMERCSQANPLFLARHLFTWRLSPRRCVFNLGVHLRADDDDEPGEEKPEQ